MPLYHHDHEIEAARIGFSLLIVFSSEYQGGCAYVAQTPPPQPPTPPGKFINCAELSVLEGCVCQRS